MIAPRLAHGGRERGQSLSRLRVGESGHERGACGERLGRGRSGDGRHGQTRGEQQQAVGAPVVIMDACEVSAATYAPWGTAGTNGAVTARSTTCAKAGDPATISHNASRSLHGLSVTNA